MRASFSAVLLLAFALGQTSSRTPNILLITLDTTRADRMGFLGSTRGLTPNLDRLARDGVVFTRAFSQAPVTPVSHATLLTGTFPPRHRVNEFGAPLPASVPYLPQLLRDNGYRTGAFVGSLILDPKAGMAPGFDRGFDVYDAGFRLQRPGENRYATVERRADDVVARAVKWLSGVQAPAAGGPWFLWAHLFDPHDPYDPPADLKARFRASPYDGEIAAVDRAAGRLIEAVGTDTVIVVAADHGEALGDHGEDTHGVFLYDEVLHVPLVIRLPGRASAGTRVTQQVRLADVAPSVLDVARLAVPASMQGESLMLFRQERDTVGTSAANRPPTASRSSRTTEDRPVYAETDYPRQAFGWSPLAAWRADRFLLVRAPMLEVYDVVADPRETRNLAATRARLVDGMSAELREFITRSSGPNGPGGAQGTRIDPELAGRLAALGYVSGSGAPANSGIDPKDRIGIANDLHRAELLVDAGAFARALPLLTRVTTAEPEIPLAQLQLGVARVRQRQYALAIAPLTKAAALQPGQMTAHYELGVALYETGDLRAAATHFEIVAAKMPQYADARYSLGSVYARIGRVADAVTELRAAIELEPRHFRGNLLLGRILTLQNRAEQAVPYLRTAVDVDPRSTEARAFLAEALKKP
jgi:arylsulfatase A-like enzyme/Flp pilus assembly protein TadD